MAEYGKSLTLSTNNRRGSTIFGLPPNVFLNLLSHVGTVLGFAVLKVLFDNFERIISGLTFWSRFILTVVNM